MHADLIRELTLIKLPVIFDDGPTIAKVRDLKSAKLIVATLSEPADPRPYAVVSAIVPAVRAAEEAKGLVRVHFVGGDKDGEYADMLEPPPVIGFSSRLLGGGRTLYNLNRNLHLAWSRSLYLLDGAPDVLLYEAAERLNRAGVRSSSEPYIRRGR
jgi:hypothetical protein